MLSFRDGPKDQTRNLEVTKHRKTMSGFRVRAFSAPRNDASRQLASASSDNCRGCGSAWVMSVSGVG